MTNQPTEPTRSGQFTIIVNLNIALGSPEANAAAAREWARDMAGTMASRTTRVVSTQVLLHAPENLS